MKRRKFTEKEKLIFLQESENDGVSTVCRKYNIAPSLFYKWRKQFESGGYSGLSNNYQRVDPKLRKLEEENERLKRIVAKQALEIEVKSELLKKTPIQKRRN